MQVQREAYLPYTVEQLYQLINDVLAYPNFLQGCISADVLSESSDVMVAKLGFRMSGVEHSFTTRNTLVQNQSVYMDLVEGPFERLQGIWTLKMLGDLGCKISLQLDFQIKSGLVASLAGRAFNELGDRMVNSMVSEAHKRFKPQP